MANLQLVVENSAFLSDGDTYLQSLLGQFGHTVSLVENATAPSVGSTDLVVLSGSTISTSGAQDYSGENVPILCLGRAYWPKLGWSTSDGVANGAFVSTLRPWGAAHPTHAGFPSPGEVAGDSSDDVIVLSQDTGNWRQPENAPASLDRRWRLANLTTDNIFTFEASSALLDSKTALQRQAGWGIVTADDFQYLTADGEAIMSALVDWTLNLSSLNSPSGFTFTAGSGTQTLSGSWNAVSGADGYDWEVERDASGSWVAFTSGSTTTATSFALDDTDGVAWGETYRARVRATAV